MDEQDRVLGRAIERLMSTRMPSTGSVVSRLESDVRTRPTLTTVEK
jgi:hypothetical protein